MVFYLVVYTVVLKLFVVVVQRSGKCEPTRAQCAPGFGTNLSPPLPTVCVQGRVRAQGPYPFIWQADVCLLVLPVSSIYQDVDQESN
jgi:hypothetical protein